MNTEDEIKKSEEYNALEECLHLFEGVDEFNALVESLEHAQDWMLCEQSELYRDTRYEIENIDDPSEYVPRRE